MNKAKMTFRFDHGPQKTQQRQRSAERTGKEQQPNIIPLHSEEYRVLDEQPAREQGWLVSENGASVPPASQRGASAPPLIDGQMLNQYTTDFGGWQSSFDMETQRVEKLIRDSGGATVTREPSVSNEPGYRRRGGEPSPSYEPGYRHGGELPVSNDPEYRQVEPSPGYEPGYRNGGPAENHEREPVHEDYAHPPVEPLRDHRWYVPEETAYITKRPGSSWFKIITSVAGAVITGVAFGFFVLSMFSGESKDAQSTAGANVPPGQTAAVPASASSSTAGTNGTSAAGAAANTATAAVSLPAKTYSFLQSGVFSTAQSASTAQAELKTKGYGAVSEAGDKYTVYVGMSMSRDEALGLAQQFQQKKIDVMVKNVELPALSQMKWSGKTTDAFVSYINQGDKLLGLIAPLTATHLSETKPSPVADAALQSIKTAHQAWTGMANAASEGLSEEGKAAVQKMNSALNTAVVSLDEYKKNPSASFMWQTQTAMMQYIVSQKELRNLVAAQ
ncbi:SPOR domain-containing protein [Paenibacillus sp. TAB 01]|uniref:SPOR domain-containing protein n=1 Tax=Paenibacillus sp. TAB 01 TaxID=3368988 RepID=UPI0037501AC4